MNESPQVLLAAQKYIKSIRNNGKRAYALLYWRWLTGRGNLTKEPDYQHADISYMAAQSVRIELNEILGPERYQCRDDNGKIFKGSLDECLKVLIPTVADGTGRACL